jgi:hypothetical protein
MDESEYFRARGAGARELVVSVVMLDRHVRTLADLLKENSSPLSEAIKSSGQVTHKLIIHGLILGMVAGDRFPPVPEWVVFAATGEPCSDDYKRSMSDCLAVFSRRSSGRSPEKARGRQSPVPSCRGRPTRPGPRARDRTSQAGTVTPMPA